MRIRTVSLSQIQIFLGNRIKKIYGPIDRNIDNLADVSHTNEMTLDWINPSKVNKQKYVEESQANVIIVDSSIEYTDFLYQKNKTLLVVDNPKLVIAQIGNEFFGDKADPGIHSSAIFDDLSCIGEGVSVGPFSYIGKAKIGRNTIIGSNVRIYDDVIIGEYCKIKDGAVIGGEGFGFETDENGNRLRFPQIGDVLIGNHVEIGANTCIDRGAFSSTIIGDNTKINNLCHIAHNNIIGKDVTIAALVNLSGGNIIEDECWISPSSSLRGYIHVGKGSTIGTGAVVIKNIPEGEVWIGNPAKKLR